MYKINTKHSFHISFLTAVVLIITSCATDSNQLAPSEEKGNKKKLVELFQKEAAEGWEAGLNAHRKGDYELALRELNRAASVKEPRAEYLLGTMYQNGQGTKRNIEFAFNLYQRSAKSGFPPAQFALGTFYRKGITVDKDLKIALEWYERAATKEHAKAQLATAMSYHFEKGVSQDMDLALFWYESAAEKGVPTAHVILGSLYQKGVFPYKDNIKAHSHFDIAVQLGEAEAIQYLDSVMSEMTPEEIEEAEKQTARWFFYAKKSSTNNN